MKAFHKYNSLIFTFSNEKGRKRYLRKYIDFQLINFSCFLCFLCFLTGLNAGISAQSFVNYTIGTPVLTEIYVDPVNGNDGNSGLSPATPVLTLYAAFSIIPSAPFTTTGYRINLASGIYQYDEAHSNYYSGKTGTYNFPLIVQGNSAAEDVTILGGLNLNDFEYLYLIDLKLRAGSEAGHQASNNVLHIEGSNYVLMRNLIIQGDTTAPLADTNNTIQEVLKINQAQHIYLENCELSGTFQTVLDYFSVQYGHVRNCTIHHSGGRGMYCKGGSAYLLIDANEVYNCREAGIQAGEGSNFPLMVPPWIHYEAYDIKIVNNIVHDIYGGGLTCAGGYNILMAYNTLCRIGLDHPFSGASYGLVELVHGGRGCYPADELGGNAGTIAKAQELLALGGWGTAILWNNGYWIPNRNVFIYNNIFYNPPGYGTRYVQIIANGAIAPPAGSNIPNPSLTDDSIFFRGNIIWNNTIEPGELIGSNNGSVPGCQMASSCDPANLLAENYINEFEPGFEDPFANNYFPVAGGSLFSASAVETPPFSWEDAPQNPPVPQGTLTNNVVVDYSGFDRLLPAIPGAHILTATAVNDMPGRSGNLFQVFYEASDQSVKVISKMEVRDGIITLIDSLGRVISQHHAGNNPEISVSCGQLPAGPYLVSIKYRNNQVETHKVNLVR
jgi:hypothetical protein